jgi:hypothetical protein
MRWSIKGGGWPPTTSARIALNAATNIYVTGFTAPPPRPPTTATGRSRRHPFKSRAAKERGLNTSANYFADSLSPYGNWVAE